MQVACHAFAFLQRGHGALLFHNLFLRGGAGIHFGTQFFGALGDALFQVADEAVQFPAQVVEGFCQTADLVVGLDGNGRVAFALVEVLHACQQGVERTRQSISKDQRNAD